MSAGAISVAEAALQDSQAMLRMAGRLSRMGAWSVALPDLKVTWTDEVCAIHEVPPGFTPTVAESLAFYAAEHRETMTRAFGDCARDGTPYDVELQIVTGKGRRVWVRSMGEAEREGAGVIRRVQGAIQDISDRKQAEEETRRLVERITTTLDSMTDAFLTMDREWRLTFVNREAERLLRRTREELTGRNIWTVFPDAIGSTFDLEYRRALEDNQTVTFEEFYAPLNLWVSIRAYPSEQGLAVYFRDITEQKRAAEALRASTEDFRALAEAMPQIVWITRPDGWNVYCNQRWMDYTGLTLEESLGQGWNTPFHPEDQARAWDSWQRALATRGTHSVECRLRRADGAYRWWLIRGVPLLDADNNILKWFGTCTDIHDLKLSQLELSRSEERFAKVFRSGLVAIGIAEKASGRFIDVNDRCAEFFGYARAEMIGRTVFELGIWVDSEDRQRVVAGIATSGSPLRTEAAFRRKSGEIRHALVSMEAMTLAGMPETLNMVALVDITEHKVLEAQFLQAQKMEAVGRLAGGVAHDFNNSLGVILGYAELLMRQAGDAQKGKLEQILKATHHASGLTRQLLAFSRKQVVDPKVLDLNVLLGGLQKMLGRLIGEHIELTIVPGADLGQVKADPGQLEQVVMNLCVNARDAMPDGGVLRLETANAEMDASHAARQEPMAAGQYVMLAVSDTGCGIEKEIQSKIFDPFFTTKEQGKGTGLGLAMVYGSVKQAGGSVWVYSEVGRGTTFKIYLPRTEEGAAVRAAPEPPMPSRGWETILLVEDDGSLRALAREILEENGYRVIEAADPNEALEIVRRRPEIIHLLVTDVVMPGMNGRALAESLVAARPGLKVLYMSGYTDDLIAHSGVLESGTLLLEKPFTALSLLGRVHTALGERTRKGNP